MRITILILSFSITFLACKTQKAVVATSPTPNNAGTPQPMHVSPPAPLENTPPITSPLLIGTWELDSLISQGNAVSMANLPNKNTMQFTGAGLMIVKGTDQKEKFFTYNYKDSMISTVEQSTPMYVKSLNSRSLVVLVKAEGNEVKMVYKKK